MTIDSGPRTFAGIVRFLNQLRAHKFGLGPAVFQEITSGAITFVSSHMQIDGEGGAADDLTTIVGGGLGDILLLRPFTDAYLVTVKHGSGGSDNIRLEGGGDKGLGSAQRDSLLLMKVRQHVSNNVCWQQISFTS